MTSPRPGARRGASGVLLAARTVYAYNWYDIGAVPTLIEHRFNIGTVDFGIVLGAFLLGAAIFQVPAGFVALRWGNRSTSIFALVLMGSCTLASGFAPTWTLLAALRFGAGVGAAFFFAPALGLITSYYPEGERGPVIGLYNGGFSLGSAAGLIAGAVIGELYGWGATLAVGGAMLLLVVPPALRLPAEVRPNPPAWSEVVARAGRIVRSRALWGLTLAGAGLWAGYYIAAQYFVEFASVVHPSWTLALAAAVPTVMILTEIGSGPLWGWVVERSRDMRWHFLGWGLVAAVLLVVLPALSFALIWPAFVALGFAAGATWAILYLIPTYLPGLGGDGYSLAVALLNSVQIFLGSALSLGFALVATGVGYTTAWVYAGAISAAFLPTLWWVGRVNARARTVPTGVAGTRASPPT